MGGSTKQALLQALSAAEGAYISGQPLAEALGVSRAAVHKAAQALSAQGYALDSAPVSYTHLDVYKRQAGSPVRVFRSEGYRHRHLSGSVRYR